MLPKDVTEHEPIYEKELTTRRPAGGQILAVAIVQLDTSEWIINVQVSWKGSKWLDVCLWERRTLKRYKRLNRAVRHVILDYGYDEGHITVIPNKAGKSESAF
ncbi:hypothetical protein ABVV53_13690 [Novosphingobium sp. RD2P27]|uniref:Uncharacterized protein n=1 Tax=Novosphingobium kalidii TaxID=3230299 RepID=A0ABV2D3Q1_9SPHN